MERGGGLVSGGSVCAGVSAEERENGTIHGVVMGIIAASARLYVQAPTEGPTKSGHFEAVVVL